MEQKRPAVGLIGLGNAGMALAQPLLSKFELVGHDRDAQRVAIAQKEGVQIASSAAELVTRCEIVLLSLPTPAASRAAAEEMAQGELAGRLIIETSTVAPQDIAWLQQFAQARGASVIDSAIVGGVQKLTAGQTTFLVGATDEDYAKARNVLETAAEEIFHLGLPGSGMRAKLVNNAIAHTTMVMLMEGAALAKKAGVPMSVFYTLMERESGLMRPLTHRFGERIKQQNFEGGMPTVNARKDSVLILDLARELGVPLFTMQASHSVYEIAGAEGLDRQDYASISRLWEKWLGVEFGYEDE